MRRRAKTLREAESADAGLCRPHGIKDCGEVVRAATKYAVAVRGVVDALRVAPSRGELDAVDKDATGRVHSDTTIAN
eukprot:6550380-Heterocapsa_arctica.AAC.1